MLRLFIPQLLNIKMIEKPFVLLFLLCLLPLGVSAQSIVKGIVTDPSGEPVIGATVKVDGSKLGVITDLDGKFSIDAAPDATLTITYVGMEPKTVKAEAGKTLSITLKDDSKKGLEELCRRHYQLAIIILGSSQFLVQMPNCRIL